MRPLALLLLPGAATWPAMFRAQHQQTRTKSALTKNNMPPSPSRGISIRPNTSRFRRRAEPEPGGSARHKEGAEALRKVEEALMNEEEAKTKERKAMELVNPDTLRYVDPNMTEV